jgi:hypothetical protein
MAVRINPFQELYAGDSVSPDKYINMFSDVIVKHALLLFQPGNVILKGLAGSGKSMLLSLLKPDNRIAYARAGQKFPVPEELSKFIGAGINLKRSGISDFGQRPIGDSNRNALVSPIYFGDFLNYWVVYDIFKSIRILNTDDQGLAKKIGIRCTNEKFNSFAERLSKLDCWIGYLDGVRDFQDLESRINGRISTYRKFLNYNLDDLPNEMHNTKTLIGIPIAKTVEILKVCEIIDPDTEVYIRIDQYEELAYIDGLGNSYREMIHKLLGLRDTNVSYRIGTRYFSWTGDEKMYGTDALLESKRNYSVVSIDSVFRRPENSRTWAFPEFAEDIFFRRMSSSPYVFQTTKESLIARVFGTRSNPAEIARAYVPSNPERAILLDEDWPIPWQDFLKKLAKNNPLSARLGEAWARQKGKEKITKQTDFSEPYPWEEKARVWWRKERIEQALTQIASRNSQQLIWYGRDDILGLSGGHILIFLSICRQIWDVWIRDNRHEAITTELPLPHIAMVIQSVGILEASRDWFNDMSNYRGGKERKTFVSFLGALFYKNLVEDRAMSYPGRNGFSLTVEDLEKSDAVQHFLRDACNYGDLYDGPHTSKTSDKKQRRKYYLNPILSPHFRIPYAHTKEPLYVDLSIVTSWLVVSGVLGRDKVQAFLVERDTKGHEDGMQGTFNF